jgi:hypothetical protein
MSLKIFKVLTVLLIHTGLINEINAQSSINFSYNDGSQNSYALQDVRKLDFNGNDINLHLNDGSIFTWNVNTIGYYDYNTNTPLKIDDILHKANDWDVNVFPNPSDGHQTLKLKLPQSTELSISIIDISGKKIFQQQLGNLTKGEHSIPLDWSNSAAGSYSVVLNSKDFSVTKKLIKK